MPIKHVTKQIEAYLDKQLSPKEVEAFEDHISICPTCAYRLFAAQRITNELTPLLKNKLGQPTPPSRLHQQVRGVWLTERASRRFNWALPGKMLNAVGTIAVVGVMAFGVMAVTQGQFGIETEPISNAESASLVDLGGRPTPIPTPAIAFEETQPSLSVVSPTPGVNSLGDTIAIVSDKVQREPISVSVDEPQVSERAERPDHVQTTNSSGMRSEPPMLLDTTGKTPSRQRPIPPEGTIAFALYNPHLQFYETHFINTDGSNLQKFELPGVSEPALVDRGNGDFQIAYRAWGDPTAPRALGTSASSGQFSTAVTDFWEDAQADWSPTENRIIFASQRESDRYWRLYTAWGDGSMEVNLRREGKSPTFAPDGYRFAFESCDSWINGYQCGLWLADLENSEHGASPLLLDSLAKAPDWSPTGEDIAYMANPNGNWDIYMVDSDGDNVRRLTHSSTIEGLPTWSSDGEWLAFVSDREDDWGIWMMHVDSGYTQSVITFDDVTLGPPERPPFDERYWWDEQLSWSSATLAE